MVPAGDNVLFWDVCVVLVGWFTTIGGCVDCNEEFWDGCVVFRFWVVVNGPCVGFNELFWGVCFVVTSVGVGCDEVFLVVSVVAGSLVGTNCPFKNSNNAL